HLVTGARLAVIDIAPSIWEGKHEVADFDGEWMMLPIASRVQPQDLPYRARPRQRMQHRQNRRRPDSRAEQHHRPLSGLQNETSARRADTESIAHPDMLPQVAPSHTIRLDLHADSIAFRRECARKRVAAKKGRAAGARLKTQDHVLAWQSRW